MTTEKSPPPPARWCGVGSADASEVDPGASAADQALLHHNPKLVAVFCSEALDLEAALRAIRARIDAPLIGCTTAGEIATSGPRDASIVVTVFGGEGFAIDTAWAEGASHDLRAAGATAARCVPSSDAHPHRVLLLLTDGLAGDQQEILRGAYGVLGAAVPLVGGCAGDDLKMSRTLQLHGDRILSDSVVAAGIASNAPLGIGVRHGWRRVGEPMLVTASAGNRVYTLDDRPALDVYLERMGAPAALATSDEGLARVALTHPLGLSRPNGEEHVRFIGGADFADRSLLCVAEVPQGALAWLMTGDAESVLAAADAACDDSLAALGGGSPVGMLAFDCIARRGVLGDDGIRTEIDRIAACAGGAPVAGFYTYGEIARTKGISGFHNQTLVVLSVA
jgi:hypothetical protein